ncbi:MAG: AAA family ATPase [Pseudomonadota bacterium]
MYKDFYGFSGKPFQLTPDLKFLFPTKGHKRAMSYMNYGLEQSEGFVVITGHIGTGKTMLIQKLLADLQDQEIATARVAAANLDADNVVSTVAAALGQPHEGKSKVAILRHLEKSLLHAREYLRGVLLIVDEAQTLTPAALEELRILSNLESRGSALMQIFLVGQTELRETLKLSSQEQLRQRIIASYHLEPLTLDETKHYIGYRLVAVGWNGKPSLAPEVYDEVQEWTDGIPRKINMLMDRLLVYGYLEEVLAFEQEHINAVIEEMSEELAGDLVTPLSERELPATGATPESADVADRLAALEKRLESLATMPPDGKASNQ